MCLVIIEGFWRKTPSRLRWFMSAYFESSRIGIIMFRLPNRSGRLILMFREANKLFDLFRQTLFAGWDY
jgi:hypothetical protein